MADDEIGARLTLKDRKQFSSDADRAARDVRHIGNEADKAGNAGKRMGSGMGIAKAGLRGIASVAKIGAMAVGAATAAVIALGIQGFNSLRRIEVIAAQTDAAIRSTGGVANVTREDIDGLAKSLEGLTGIEAESITEGQNLLLTFTKVRNEAGKGNDIFDQATAAMVNMSTALGTDASGAALQLGKALNDPIKGVGALSRAGVSFTQEQKDQIKALQESGDMLGAQKLIMSELETQFGGSAEAYGKTTTGLIEKTKNVFGDLQENIVTKFTPSVNGGIQKVHDYLLNLLNTSEQWLPKIASKFTAVSNAVKSVWNILSGAFSTGGITGVASELDSLMGTGDMLTGTIEALKSIFESLGTIWTDLVLPVLKDFNEMIPRGIRPIEIFAAGLRWIADNGETLQPILAALLGGFLAFKVISGILKAITAAQAALNLVMSMNPIGLVVTAIAALAAGLIYAYKHSETFRNIVDGAFRAVKNVVMGVYNWVKDNWPLLLAILTGPIGLAVLVIKRNWGKIKDGVTGVKNWIVKKFDAIVSFVTELPGRITGVASSMWDGIKDAFKSAINWIIDAWNGLEFTVPSIDLGPLGSIGGWTVGMPDIPRLHTGGTTTTAGMVNMKPDEELIFLPPSASVVPMTDDVRSMAASVGEGGGGSREPIVLQVVLDRKVIAEAVYSHAGDRLARA